MKKKVDFCPILQYTCVLSANNGNVKYFTTVEKFEYDMRCLVENGYTSLSLEEYRIKKKINACLIYFSFFFFNFHNF